MRRAIILDRTVIFDGKNVIEHTNPMLCDFYADVSHLITSGEPLDTLVIRNLLIYDRDDVNLLVRLLREAKIGTIDCRDVDINKNIDHSWEYALKEFMRRDHVTMVSMPSFGGYSGLARMDFYYMVLTKPGISCVRQC